MTGFDQRLETIIERGAWLPEDNEWALSLTPGQQLAVWGAIARARRPGLMEQFYFSLPKTVVKNLVASASLRS